MIFYRDPGAIITHEVFVSRRPYRQFALRELTYVHTRRPSAVEILGTSQTTRVFSAGLAGVAGAVALASGTVTDWPRISIGAVVVLVLASVVSIVARDLRSRQKRLWAIYRGELTCIYSNADVRTFNQVVRATARAFEWIEART